MQKIRVIAQAVTCGLWAAMMLAILPISVAEADAGTGSSVLGPDPMEPMYPQYWEYGNPAGSTGPAPQPGNIPYTEGGQHAGGTGDVAEADQTPYFDQGEDAGGV